MATTDRQNRLLVAEDWRKIYTAFQQANFKSYDFETIRRTMVAYLRENYPDDFNDYIESSEYVALLDLIAYISQSLSFRVDLNMPDIINTVLSFMSFFRVLYLLYVFVFKINF